MCSIGKWDQFARKDELILQGGFLYFGRFLFDFEGAMKLFFYNTLTREKEEFIPRVAGKVGMYSCGPTVYRTPSIGNYRATFTADLIRNTLKLLGYEVTSVMNITDVGHLVGDGDEGEDKLEKGSKRDGISARDVAKKYENIFKEGIKKLNIDEFDVMPRATEHIPEQIAMVKTLEEKGYTYTVPGDGIYMDTSKVEDYGKLMGPNYKKRLEDLNAGERVDMGGKKHPTDFALWKFSPTDEKRQMERDSPRGAGFPGWHIECSAMSSKYLGQQFDIHHGGADHITIHHPNEIAQSECACGCKPWVKYWIHNEFLQVDGGKMSKSLGNVYNLDDVAAKGFSPLDLRYFYFMAQYGSFQNFTWDQLKAAKNSRENLIKKIRFAIKDLNLTPGYEPWKKYSGFSLDQLINSLEHQDTKKSQDINTKQYLKNIIDSLEDNLNTPGLLSVLDLSSIKSQDGKISVLYWLDKNLLKLGLFEEQEIIEIPAKITVLAEQRVQAKKDKNYTLADELRNQIASMGWQVKDSKDGYEIVKG